MRERAPKGILGSLDEVLRDPDSMVQREATGYPWALMVGTMLCLALYGAIAGTFQGGQQILVAAIKAPLILISATLLCLPSYYVFVALGGSRSSPMRLLSHLAGFLGIVSLLFAALLPIAWLFSISTRSLGFMGFFHLVAFLLALSFGTRFLRRCHSHGDGRAGLLPWILLLSLVTIQVSAQLRPVLYRADSTPFFAPQREFFLEHWGDSIDRGPIPMEDEP